MNQNIENMLDSEPAVKVKKALNLENVPNKNLLVILGGAVAAIVILVVLVIVLCCSNGPDDAIEDGWKFCEDASPDDLREMRAAAAYDKVMGKDADDYEKKAEELNKLAEDLEIEVVDCEVDGDECEMKIKIKEKGSEKRTIEVELERNENTGKWIVKKVKGDDARSSNDIPLIQRLINLGQY